MAINFLKVRNGITLKPVTAPSTPENGDVYYDSGSNLFQLYQNGSWVGVGTSTATPTWTRTTLTFSSFSAAALTNDISLVVLPAKTMLHQVVLKHSAPMAGSGLTSYTVSVGLATNFTAYTQPFDVKQAVSQTGRSITQVDDVPNFGSTQDVRIQAVSTGTNLNNVTSGTLDVWLLTSVLP